MSAARKHRRWPFGRHTWHVEAVQVEHFTSGDQTNVLHSCDCGKVKVEVIDGGWTPEQLGLRRAAS